ncbi:TetR family transcriptional regulator [Arthrobacter sp. BHU FT2]|nr:TetR family transcriptional regulator [Arthrobacter sp. BHU FT2]
MTSLDASRRDTNPPKATPGRGGGKEAVIGAALRVFSESGYHGASMRNIAAAAAITLGSIYHHYPGKQEILQAVMLATMEDAINYTREAIDNAGPDAKSRLAELVRAWVRFHTQRQVEARVSASELHFVEGPGRSAIVALRDQQERMFSEVVRDGVAEGTFYTPHPKEAVRAIINMGTSVALWYRKDGDKSPEELADVYAELALALVQAKELAS